ncbi:cytosine permease, partial [Litchfieldella rifensis]
MKDSDLDIQSIDPTLYNEDLAPIPHSKRSWGWFEIFNVWSNDIQSLFGYTLAASLFLTYGLNGWAVMAAIILAGVIVMYLVNLTGKPSVKYGVPFPVMIRASMGVRGANFPAMLRAIIGIFWYGVQTYFASTAVALLITALFGAGDGSTFLGLSGVAWVSFVIVWVFQIAIFWQGI